MPPRKKARAAPNQQAIISANTENLPNWAYDVAGTWEIDASKLSHDIFGFEHLYPDAPPPFTIYIKYTNSPAPKNAVRQLWATFSWGKMNGVMRMCPGHKYVTSHLQFYDSCLLEPGVWPGPSPHGTPIWNFRWRAGYGDDKLFFNSGSATDEWETQLEFSRDPNGTMKLSGKMVIGGYKARKFVGVKTGQQIQPNGDDKTLKDWWGSLRDPAEESREELCRGCKGAMDDSSEDESDPELEIDWDAMRKEREVEQAREAEQDRQPWPTEMIGQWEISSKNSDKDETTSSYMNIYYEDGRETAGRRQYYADFKISPSWHGIMRFCPVGELDTEKNQVSVEEFEKACILKDGVNAGPPPHGVNEWLVKWRGLLIDPNMPAEPNQPRPRDDMTTSIKFKLGEDGKLVSRFILLEDGLIRFFKGVRIGDGKPRDLNDPTVEKLWEDRKFKVPPPPPPKLWPWQSPLPTPNIEGPPAWAWDVLGKWEITAPIVAEALNIDEDAPMSMTIHLANDPKKKKIGRQLWAIFTFGPNVSGCMRFCPLPENSHPADTVAQFEKLCVLKKGVWPGDSASKPGKSFQKWGFRWRALDDRGKSLKYSDTVEHMFEFSRDENGTLKLQGVFGAIYQMCPWSAVKVQNGLSVDTNVNTVWNSY